MTMQFIQAYKNKEFIFHNKKDLLLAMSGGLIVHLQVCSLAGENKSPSFRVPLSWLNASQELRR